MIANITILPNKGRQYVNAGNSARSTAAPPRVGCLIQIRIAQKLNFAKSRHLGIDLAFPSGKDCSS